MHRISNLSPLNMKNILFTTYHLCIVIVNIYVLERQNMRVFSLNLDVKRKENTKISSLTECGDLLGGGDSLTVAPVRVLVRHAHCRLQGVHITVSAMVQGVYRVCGLTAGRVCTELPRGVARPGPVVLHRHHAATGRTLGTPGTQQSYSWWRIGEVVLSRRRPILGHSPG